jgi:hypothetical protein
MSDLEVFLNWVSRIRLLCTAGLAASITVGIMVLNGAFDPVLSWVLGIASVLVLVASIGGLIFMQKLIWELEESFHRDNFNLSLQIMHSKNEA